MKRLFTSIASAIALVVASACGGGGGGGQSMPTPSPVPQQPAPPSRPGVLYGYYGTIDEQVAETQSHANLQWAGPWSRIGDDSYAAVMRRLREARDAKARCVMLEVPQVYEVDAETKVRHFFRTLYDAGLLDGRICAMYPIDEPDYQGKSAEQVVAANAMLRRVSSEFLAGLPLAVIYTADARWPGIESYDWIGFDWYHVGAAVVDSEQYQELKRRLRPEQRIILVPGAHQCDDIQPFYQKAQEDLQVVAVIPFIWFDGWDWNTEKEPYKGLRSLPCRTSYEEAGTKLKDAR